MDTRLRGCDIRGTRLRGCDRSGGCDRWLGEGVERSEADESGQHEGGDARKGHGGRDRVCEKEEAAKGGDCGRERPNGL